MSQLSSGDPALHPVLQAALRSLDVELATALGQYRYHRGVRSFSPLAHPVSQTQLAKTPGIPSSRELAAPQPSENSDLAFSGFSDQREAANLATSNREDASLLELTRSRLNPESYLASSKVLLKNLQEISTPRKVSPVKVLLTAWGATIMLLMLLGTGVGYLVIHLSSPSRSRLADTRASETPKYPVPNLRSPHRSPAATSTPKSAISPDLSTEEFVKLDLPNLSQLQPYAGRVSQSSPKPTPTMTSSPATGAGQDKAGRTASTAPPSPGQEQSPQTGQQPSRPATAPITVAAASRSPKEPYYYVLTNYTSAQSLQQVQKVVKDAHVRKFPEGQRVQVGAFYDSQSAQKLVQELKRQGVPATVRKP